MRSLVHKAIALVMAMSPLLALPGTASAISSSPTTLDFGNVPLNTTVTRDLAVTVDAGYFVIGGYMPAAPGFTLDKDTCLVLVGPGTCNVKLSYTPATVADVTDTLTLVERPQVGSDLQNLMIGLTARGVSAYAADPTSLAFGDVPLNTTATRELTVTVDAGYKVSGAYMPRTPGFTIEYWRCLSLVAPGTCTITVSYTPTTLGDVSDTITINERALVGTDIQPLAIGLTATGVNAVEATPPTTTATAESGGGTYSFGTWTRNGVVVTLSAADNPGGSGVARTEYSLDGETWYAYAVPFGVSAEGEGSFQFRSIDNVGNVEDAQHALIRIDKTAPSGSISIDSGYAYAISTTVTLDFTADDGTGSGVSKMRLADSSNGLISAPWQDYPASHAYTLPAGDGTKTVYVQYQDAVGNVSQMSDAIVLDTTKPTISAAVAGGTSGANGWYTSSVTVHFTCTDDGSGIPAGTCPGDQVLSAEGSSVASTAQTVIDAAGLASNRSNVVTVKIDKTAPTVGITDPKPDDAVQDVFSFGATLSDAVSGADALSFSVRSDDGSANGKAIGFEDLAATKVSSSGGQATFRLAFDTTKLSDGYYLLLARGADVAGNVSSSSAAFNHVKVVNLALVKLLPATDSNKAGRTMPVKFSIREASSRSFVENQQLTVTIREKGSSTILQRSTYGTSASAYRIDRAAETYITNFQTRKTPATYVVEVWRQTATAPLLVGSFEFQTVK